MNVGVYPPVVWRANGQILMQHPGPADAQPPYNIRYYYLHDRLGSVREVIDKDAAVVRHYSYEPFGKTIEETGTLTNPFMFTGQYYDSEVGQYYLRARQYDPQLMRFTGRDPVEGKFEEPMSLHKYLYCLNDPIDRYDPLGLDSVAFYDGSEKGYGPARLESAEDYDWYFNVGSPKDIALNAGLLSDVGVSIDDVYIFDHGYLGNSKDGKQQVGDTPLSFMSREWIEMCSYLSADAEVHLRGCSVAAGTGGKYYLMMLAYTGNVKVDAFDDLVTHDGEHWGGADYYSYGNLWQASPGSEPVNISPGGVYRDMRPFRRR